MNGDIKLIDIKYILGIGLAVYLISSTRITAPMLVTSLGQSRNHPCPSSHARGPPLIGQRSLSRPLIGPELPISHPAPDW